jgi:hypothetical protein
MEINMKLLHTIVLGLIITAATVTAAQARDSFSLGINVGGHSYAPQPVYYAAPPVIYYEPQVYYREPVYYRPAPRVYYAAPTVISFGYQNYGGHQYRGHYDGWRHESRGHHGWKRGRGHHDHD